MSRWGGEILYDNYTVIINERAGGDYGVQVLYGKNIVEDGFTESIDMTEVVTRIIPKAYNGYMLEGNEPWVDSPLIKNYPTAHTKVIAFENVKMREDAKDDEEDAIICDTQEELEKALKEKCKEQYDAGIDKPKVTISVDMELLQNTELYADVTELEKVSLGDTVHCRHSKLGITSDARVIELEWDAVRDKITSVVLGDYEYDFLDDVSSVTNKVGQAIRSDGSVIGEQIKGIIDGIKTQLRVQTSVAQKQGVRAILFEDLDKDSPLYGAMALGTQGIEISKVRTEDDRDWDWTTTMTAEGIMANTIIAGILSDKIGKNYWDLNKGIVHMDLNSFTLSGSTVTDIAKNAAQNAAQDAVQKEQYLTMNLTSEFQAIPTDSTGAVDTIEASTTVSVLFGKKDATNDAAYTITLGEGTSGTWNAEKHTYTITGITQDTGYVDIRAEWSFEGEKYYATRRFSVSKLKQGEQGEQGGYYTIDGPDALTWDADNEYWTPQNPRYQGYYIESTGARGLYLGSWKVEYSPDGNTWIKKDEKARGYNITVDTSAYTLSSKIMALRVTLYKFNTTQILAQKTVQFQTNFRTQRDLFNMLTNNGAFPGIFMKNNQMYINATYVATGILSSAKGKSYWNLRTGEMLVTGNLMHRNGSIASVEIAENQVKVYDWTKDGNHVGSYGAIQQRGTDRVGVDLWCTEGNLLGIGYYGSEDGEEAGVIPVIQIDAKKAPTETPWIRNTASGTLFPENESGGIKVENGLVKDWGISSWSGQFKTADGKTIVVKDGLIQESK